MRPIITGSGILPCYKPSGIGSFDLIRGLKRRFSFKKIGHLGTLDPMAEGVLPVMINQGTKIADFLEHNQKRYLATLTFGYQTDTFDATGEVTEKASFEHVTKEALLEKMQGFIGSIEQIPPKYAAVKINGVPAYKLARAGKEVELKPRTIQIHTLELKEFNLPKAQIDILCGKGTYIRSLIHDLATQLNTAATMSTLVRSSSGGFNLDQTINPEELITPEQLTSQLITIDHLLDLPKINLKQFELKLVTNGVIPHQLKLSQDGLYQLIYNNRLKSIIERRGDQIKFLRQFNIDSFFFE